MRIRSVALWCVFLPLAVWNLYGQAATDGGVSGTITDPSGALVANASVTITNKATAAERNVSSNTDGLYAAPALQAGEYTIRAQAPGFRALLRDATVLAGTTTTVDLSMVLGEAAEQVTVAAATPQINYESQTVQGVVVRQQVQELPLNGRNFILLAGLEPGVTTTGGTPARFNSPASATVLGGGTVYYSVDGGNITDKFVNGVSINLSNEIVQEFQIQSVNFDLSQGITTGGSVNIVTRSGTNDFHGSAYYFYRDHNMAAYPVLKRNSFNPNPFFARSNPGFSLGGPILKNKLFFFFNYEYTNQRQAINYQPDLPSIAGTAVIATAPYTAKNINVRFDYKLSDTTSIFFRYTHDGNAGVQPEGANYNPSQWLRNANWGDQGIIGVTSVLSTTVVNDFRFNFRYWRFADSAPETSYCQSPCIGNLPGLPTISSMVGASSFVAGPNYAVPEYSIKRYYQYGDNISWQKGTHRFKFGADIDHYQFIGNGTVCEPSACISLYSPETTRSQVSAADLAAYFPNLPTVINSDQALLNVPVNLLPASHSTGFGVGDGTQPGPYDFDKLRHLDLIKAYATDSWKLKPNLTINYGVAYTLDIGSVDDFLSKPQFLAPLVGADNLGPVQRNKTNFGPSAGFAWSPGKSGKTVIRGGAGLYYDSIPGSQRIFEEAYIGPPGDGEVLLSPSVFTNTFPNIYNFTTKQPVPIGSPLPIGNLTNLTLGQFNQIYSSQIGRIHEILSPKSPPSGPFPYSQIDLVKSATQLLPEHYPNPKSYQMSIGVQRDMGHGLVVQGDFVRRIFLNLNLGETDLNQYNRYIGGVKTPVIPACTPSQLFVVGEECSSGSITFFNPTGRSTYDALLVKVNERMGKRLQVTAAYALASNQAVNTVNGYLYNLNNYNQTFGPSTTAGSRHNLTVQGLLQLPYGFQMSVIGTYLSALPAQPVVAGIDLYGNINIGAATTPLPMNGSYNCYNVGCGSDTVAQAVASWNTNYAGQKDARGTTIPTLSLPSRWQLTEAQKSVSTRLTKEFVIREKYRLQLFGEVFNVFNFSNLAGASTVINSSTFGQFTTRAGQVFGTSGPRAEQIGGRFSF